MKEVKTHSLAEYSHKNRTVEIVTTEKAVEVVKKLGIDCGNGQMFRNAAKRDGSGIKSWIDSGKRWYELNSVIDYAKRRDAAKKKAVANVPSRVVLNMSREDLVNLIDSRIEAYIGE